MTRPRRSTISRASAVCAEAATSLPADPKIPRLVPRWLGDNQLELRLAAPSVESVLIEIAGALGALLAWPQQGEPDRLPILGESDDYSQLLTDFLNDLAYLADIERFACRRVERIELDGTRLRAAVSGVTVGQSIRLGSMTCHSSRLEAIDGSWKAHLILDVQRATPATASASLS
jgi:hypothetical protein